MIADVRQAVLSSKPPSMPQRSESDQSQNAKVFRGVRLTAPKRTKSSWRRMASSPWSTARSPRASPCQKPHAKPTPESPWCAPRSSTSSPSRNTAWACSSAPSAWSAPRPRSPWPTWSTTCSASSGSTPEVRPDSRKKDRKDREWAGKQRDQAESAARKAALRPFWPLRLRKRRFLEATRLHKLRGSSSRLFTGSPIHLSLFRLLLF